MIKNEFTPFENEVMKWILDRENDILKVLRQQFSQSIVLSREYTGVGMYLNFGLPNVSKGIDELLGLKERFCFGDVGAKIGIQQQEVGFLVWVINGKLAFLEGYTYGDEKWPSETTDYSLYYFGNKHDIEKLSEAWLL